NPLPGKKRPQLTCALQKPRRQKPRRQKPRRQKPRRQKPRRQKPRRKRNHANLRENRCDVRRCRRNRSRQRGSSRSLLLSPPLPPLLPSSSLSPVLSPSLLSLLALSFSELRARSTRSHLSGLRGASSLIRGAHKAVYGPDGRRGQG